MPPQGLPELPDGLVYLRRLGQTPLSEVFLVTNEEGERFALKVLRGSAAKDARIRERWRREAQLLEEIRHPNLVKSYGALEFGGRNGLLMEYIDGPNLRDLVGEQALGWEQAARIGVQVGRGLQKLHRHGALHRDVKPHNILIHKTRGAVLADLGLVRRREDPTLTRQGAALGSPAYMSPEQARDPSEVGTEADVYSLGATLYHALVGRPPFLGNGVGEVIHRVLHLEPDPLPESVPQSLQDVIRVAMAKEPQRRYRRARDLANDLGRVLLGVPPRLVAGYRRQEQLRVLAGVALLSILITVGFVWWPRDQPAEDDAPILVENPQESGQATVQPETPKAPIESQVVVPPPPVDATHQSFIRWATPYEQAYERYLRTGQLRRALAEAEALSSAPLPEGADANFQNLRNSLVRRVRASIFATGEKTAVTAEELLDLEEAKAQRAIEEGDFDIQAWEETVRTRWDERNLPVDELPLNPGGADPNGWLDLKRARLEQKLAERLAERAREFIPDKRRRTWELLRQGQFLEAEKLWDNVDLQLLQYSPAGLREKVRVEQLAAKAREVNARLTERIGQRVRLELRWQAVSGRVLAPGKVGTPHRLEVNGQAVEIGLLEMSAEHLGEFLFVEPNSDLDWVRAQLLWCQGRLAEALEVMRPLGADRWRPEKDPTFWVREWSAEMGSAETDGNIASVPPAIAGTESSADTAELALQTVADLWQEDFPEAQVGVVEGGVELVWIRPEWNLQVWRHDLRWRRVDFRLVAWDLEWRLPVTEAVPQAVSWLGQVTMNKPSRAAVRTLYVGDHKPRSGLGIVPGARQSLSWRQGEQVRLDGSPVGAFQAPAPGTRLTLEAQARPRFIPEKLRVRVVPVN